MTNSTLINRALVRLSGDDVRGFLQALLTQDVTGPMPVWAGLLSPQGKALFDFILWTDGDDVLIDCERDAAGDLARRLSLYRLRRAISIDREPELCVHWSADGDMGVPDPRLSALGRRWLAPASGDAGADDAWQAHRLSLGVTEGRGELGDGTTLWLECNAAELHGVSFAKGCYVGQENTARMNWRQKVNRRLVVVPIDQSDPKRQITAYPAYGLAVDHRRVEDVAATDWRDWMGERVAATRPA